MADYQLMAVTRRVAMSKEVGNVNAVDRGGYPNLSYDRYSMVRDNCRRLNNVS